MTLEAKFFSARLLGRGSVQTRPGCADQKGFLAALEMTDWSPLSSRTKDLSLPISFSGIWQESDTQRISLNRSRASEVSVIPLWKRVAGRDFLLPCASIVPENSRFETKKLPHTTIKFPFNLPLPKAKRSSLAMYFSSSMSGSDSQAGGCHTRPGIQESFSRHCQS